MKYKAIIIDDEQSGTEYLSNLIAEYVKDIEVVATSNSVLEGLKILQKYNTVDLIFLDVEMPNGNGFDFLEAIEPGKYKVIFTTAHQEYALRAFENYVFGYLLKPIDLLDLEKLVVRLGQTTENKAINSVTKEDNILSLRTLESVEYVKERNVVRMESEGGYTTVYTTDNRSIMVSKNIKELEGLIKSSIFIKPHKSHMINKNFVKRYFKKVGGFFEMEDKTEIPVARRRKEEVLQKLSNSMK